MPKYIEISKPFGGWVPTPANAAAASAPNASLEGGKNQYAWSKGISLRRLEKYGDIAPGETFTAITDAGTYITALPLNGAVDSSGNGFVVQTNGRVVKLNTSGTATTDYFAPVVHGGHTIQSTNNPDLIIIRDATTSAVEYIVATWEDNTDADVMIIRPDGSNKNSEWMSGGALAYLVAGVPLKMTQGPDGNIYGTNRQYLWSATMAAGVGIGAATRNTQALNLGSGWVSNGICNYGNFIAVMGNQSTQSGVKRGNCRVWLWDGYSPEPNFVYDIPDNYANGIFNDNGTLLAFTNGRSNSSKIFEFDGGKFNLKFGTTFISSAGVPIQGAMESFEGGVHLATSNQSLGYVYLWENGGFHSRMVVTDGTNDATTVGMCRNLYQGQLFVGVNYSTTYKIFYQANFTNYYTPADFRTRLFTNWDDGTPIRKGKITKVHIWFSQTGTGASLLLSLFKGYDTISLGGATDAMNKTLASATLGSTKYHSFELSVDDIDSFYMNLRFNHSIITNTAYIIRKIVIEGDNTSIY